MEDEPKKKVFKKPLDWDELYPGRFLKAGDLRGKRVTLTIKDLVLDELEGESGKKVKGVLSFLETPKSVAMNKTNGICLREMFGRTLAAWFGKRITVFEGQWNGEPCLRIYGSPDIERDMEIVITLPKRRPFPMTMHKVTGRRPAPPPPPPPPPAEEEEAFEGFDGLVS